MLAGFAPETAEERETRLSQRRTRERAWRAARSSEERDTCLKDRDVLAVPRMRSSPRVCLPSARMRSEGYGRGFSPSLIVCMVGVCVSVCPFPFSATRCNKIAKSLCQQVRCYIS